MEVFGSETNSSADFLKFEQRYDVSRREHKVKSRTEIRWLTDTCALPASEIHSGTNLGVVARCQRGLATRSGKLL